MNRNTMTAPMLAALIAGVPSLVMAHDVYGMGGQGYGWPCPGMMGQGMGPGMMMGQGMGPGMIGPGMLGTGAMGQGMAPGMVMGPGVMGPGMSMMGLGIMQPLAKDLTAADVLHMIEHQLAWQRNPNLKAGKVEEKDQDIITAEVVTQEGSLVQRLELDRHTGLMRVAQ